MLFSTTIGLMEKALDWAANRQKILAHNIANADTPGYKRMDLDFPRQLEKQLTLARTHPRHLPASQTQPGNRLVGRELGPVRVDDNNVDLETETIRYAENGLYFQGLTQELRSNFQRLRTAIGGK